MYEPSNNKSQLQTAKYSLNKQDMHVSNHQ